jgi:3-methyl-2-oxobutanoate hydroxymethyltransferase
MKTSDFIKYKQENKKIKMITAYDFVLAKIAEEAGIDAILVGDSVGMVELGYDTTLPVTMEDMIHHTKAVSRGADKTLIVADMPFMSYQINAKQGMKNAGRLIQEGGANAVKLEGGVEIAETVKRIVDCGIPVMGHIGMTPQSVNAFGGFKAQGKTAVQASKIIKDAFALQDAGAFSVVLECIPEELAEEITKRLSIPTIGIGAGAKCDGQVQVISDMLGMTNGFVPRHSKKYANLFETAVEGIKCYEKEVDESVFPGPATCTHISKEIIEGLE